MRYRQLFCAVCIALLSTWITGVLHAEEEFRPIYCQGRAIAKDAISIDGQLEEPAWKDSKWTDGFRIFKTGETAEHQTQFAVLHDPEALYIGIRCDEQDLDALQQRATKRDDPVWEDDSIEMFIAPSGMNATFYQFIVNPRGVLFDARYDAKTGIDHSWNGSVRVAAGRFSGGWTLEIAVPLAELGLSPSPEALYGFNVCRSCVAGREPELSSWSFANKGFPKPESFGRLTFEGYHAKLPIEELRDLFREVQQLRSGLPAETQKLYAKEFEIVERLLKDCESEADKASAEKAPGLIATVQEATTILRRLRTYLLLEHALGEK